MNEAVVVVDYGAGNTRSVCAALRRLGHHSVVTSEPRVLRDAATVILPGVGSARSAMFELQRRGADEALRERYDEGRFTLGICLGLQLVFESSEEDGGVVGLGLLKGRVERLRAGRVPRLGWSVVEPWDRAYYFAHSYAVVSDDVTATADGVAAVVERGSFLGVQFHPEKSGPDGAAFLERCLARA